MMENGEDLTLIDDLVRRRRSFACYRLPEKQKLCFLIQTEGEPEAIFDMESINNESGGFIFAPFHIEEKYPIWKIRPDYINANFPFKLSESSDVVEEAGTFVRVAGDDFEEYASRFQSFMQPLTEGTYDKLVLSRCITVYPDNRVFSPAQAFYQACQRYLHSYVYLCYIPQTGIWLGSTPELLLSGEEGEWSTVALAGTMSLDNGCLPKEWSNKNKEEQRYVSDYIRSQLVSVGSIPEEHGPYPVYAGALSHLKTDFRFQAEASRVGDILSVLHPTPAVCGLPKEKAYQFIRGHEGYERGYYSGFVGLLNLQGRTDLYVNLRCLNYQKDELTLYAGSGLLPASELEDEWEETEKKLQTMKSLLFTDL
jgi:isochorismate synthase